MLTEHGTKVAPTTYYDARNRDKTRRERKDEELINTMERVRRDKPFTRLFGARKMWLHLRGAEGIDVARCTVERLMNGQGWEGALRRKNVRTTIADEQAARAEDRVNRQFWAPVPNRLWAADFTYVKTDAGTVYVAFIIDVFSRRIIGWMADTRMRTSLVLAALEMAVFTRRKEGVKDLTGLVHHNDAGSQGRFNRSPQHPDYGGVNGQASWMDEGANGKGADEVAWEAVASPGCGAVVLARDRQGTDQRGSRNRGRRVAGGGQSLVPGSWWNADVYAHPADRPLPII